jgi:hypothetical protein
MMVLAMVRLDKRNRLPINTLEHHLVPLSETAGQDPSGYSLAGETHDQPSTGVSPMGDSSLALQSVTDIHAP